MSYLVLARKSRPQTFEEVVGQRPVVKTLQNSLKRNRVAHAILFSGVRGVGKTTMARIMAKSLNCEQGPAPIPCNSCLSCRQITAGSSLDLYEIDGASNRGIQEVRELKQKINFLPASSPFKIVIIDEVHMLTTEAFNALLKTLEEPPAHVYFLFATTELHKIPITILSRCQRYELQRVQSAELTGHFLKLAENEGIELEQAALSLIVREAEGSVRDGLSLLDQVFSYGESPITVDDVIEVLGLVNRDILLNLAHALLSGNRREALVNLAEIFRFGMDIKRFMADLLECFRNLLLIKIDGCEKLLDLPADEIDTLHTAAAPYSAETIHQKLSLLMRTAEDIRYSTQPKLALETSFLAIIESGNIIGVTTLLEKLDVAINKLPEQPPPSGDSAEDHSEIHTEKKKISEYPDSSVPESYTSELPVPDIISEDESPPWETDEIPAPAEEREATVSNQTDTVSEQAKRDQIHPRSIRKDWIDFIAYVKERKQWMSQNLQQAASVKERDQELLLEFDSGADCTLLRSTENRKVLTEYIFDFFQKAYTIHFVTPSDSDDPGMNVSEGPKIQRQKLLSNPLVRMTEEIFGGQVGDIRIGPLSR